MPGVAGTLMEVVFRVRVKWAIGMILGAGCHDFNSRLFKLSGRHPP